MYLIAGLYFQDWIKEDNRFQKSGHFQYNQKPKASSATSLKEKLKNIIMYYLKYTFE